MFFKINKLNKPLARLTKKRERTQVNKIRNERKTTDTKEIIKKIIREKTMNNYMPTRWTTQRKWTHFWKNTVC